MATDVLAIIEAAYDIDKPTSEWFSQMLEVIEPQLGDGLGIIAIRSDLRNDETKWFVETRRNTIEPHTERWLASMASMPTAAARPMLMQYSYTYGIQSTLLLRQNLPLWREHETEVWQHVSPEFTRAALGDLADVRATDDVWYDSLLLNCMGADGVGCQFVMPRRTTNQAITPPEVGAMWRRVIAHVSNAYRLHLRTRSESAGPTREPDAVLSLDGKVEHASAALRDTMALEAMRRQVVATDRARTRREREDAATATQMWEALLDGRWSLLDEFERGGRRYVVAHPNEIAPMRAKLSEREEQIIGYLAMGHSNKLIAYSLGLAPSTIAGHVASVSAHLRASSRAELVSRALSWVSASAPDESPNEKG